MLKTFLKICIGAMFFQGGVAMALTLSSPAFKSGEIIPQKYTCGGDDISPPLQWFEPVRNTKSYVLILDDPDAPSGVWDHWILFNIPSSIFELPENVQTLPKGTVIAKNSWGTFGYRGPCPPEGSIHRYVFKLYALDTVLDLTKDATRTQLETAMKNHILGETGIVGKYKR